MHDGLPAFFELFAAHDVGRVKHGHASEFAHLLFQPVAFLGVTSEDGDLRSFARQMFGDATSQYSVASCQDDDFVFYTE